MSEKRGYCVNTGLRAEAQKWRLKFQKEALIKQKENEEIERKREAEQQLEQLRKEVQRKKEIEEKTRHYFDYNKYNRKVPADAYYFGDMEIVQNSWRPHGSGKVVVNDVPIVEGKFSKGDFYEGKIVWTDGSGWEGSMKDNMIHGVGFVVKEGERKPALAYEGKLICLREGM